MNASQRPELQFAQNVGQVFLGVNLKCASCHDSFIDNWKLTDSYGLAAIFSQRAARDPSLRRADGEDGRGVFLVSRVGERRSAGAARRAAGEARGADDVAATTAG